MAPAWMGEGRAQDTIPDHYRAPRGAGLEPWDVWEAFGLDPWSACAVKYILRAGRKGSAVEDWRKAQHYLQYLIDREELEELDRRREEIPEVKPFCGGGVECGLVDCTRCGTPPERFCADGCVCAECIPEPPVFDDTSPQPKEECDSDCKCEPDRLAPEGPLREAQEIAREMADPKYVDEPKRTVAPPATGPGEGGIDRLRWYLDRFHNGGRR